MVAGSRQTRRGPASAFTGNVYQDAILDAPDPARARALSVTFEPGARTFWHKHPLGQMLVIVSGVGRVQSWEGKVQRVMPGDVVWFGPDEKHWHGADPDHAMVHIAVQEHLDGNHVEWLEPVAEDDYQAAL